MNPEKRFERQIASVHEVYDHAHATFLKKKPIDTWLSMYFRKHKKYGSKDRKLISNAVFGFFRWYGWLCKLDESKRSLALLFGLLLDDCKVTDVVNYWIDSVFKVDVERQLVKKIPGSDITSKRAFIEQYTDIVTCHDLYPSFIEKLPDKLIKSLQQRPSLWIRTTPETSNSFYSFLSSKGISFTKHPRSPAALALDKNLNLFESQDYRKGALEVQDISSQGIGLACEPRESEIWWDVCAGSGGKALHLASLMNGKGIIYATETDKYRYKELCRRINRNKLFDCIKPIHWDGNTIPDFRKSPQHILIDAPCSCSGTWRRSPDIRWHLDEAKVNSYSNLQAGILNLVSKSAKNGSKLVYATCSIFKQENEIQIERFLKYNSQFEYSPITCPLTDTHSSKGIHFLPPETDGNAMFVAILSKKK